MRPALVCAILLCTAAAAAAALPRHGSLVPGRSLAGVRIGDAPARVVSMLGARYGLCRGCRLTTWYYTYRPFTREGLAIEFRRGRVSAVYTIWQPAGWGAENGLLLGDVEAQVTAIAGPLFVVSCEGYDAFTKERNGVQSAYYVLDGRLWGLGLLRAGATPCR